MVKLEYEILHNTNEKRFYCIIEGKESELEYSEVGAGVLNFYHTFVHPDLRGRGIAEKLVLAAAAFARETGQLVIPGCSYVAKIFEIHPELCDLLETEHGAGKDIARSCSIPQKKKGS